MRRIFVTLGLIASIMAVGANAWWCTAHMIIAEIARQNLDAGVEAKVNAQFTFLNKFFPQANDMISGSCWADDLKSNHLDAMAGWHFINQVYNPENVTVNPWPIQKINVATAITKLDKTMRPETLENENEWIQAYAVGNLLHFFGDVHQPLHATERFNKDYPHGDLGGNLIHVNWAGRRWVLHFVWDSVCGQYFNSPNRPLNGTDYQYIKSLANQYQQNFSVPEEEKAVYNSTVYALESYSAAVSYAYANNTVQPDETLSQKYIDDCKVVAGYRIAYAGYRLANELNYIFRENSQGKRLSPRAILSRVNEIKAHINEGKH